MGIFSSVLNYEVWITTPILLDFFCPDVFVLAYSESVLVLSISYFSKRSSNDELVSSYTPIIVIFCFGFIWFSSFYNDVFSLSIIWCLSWLLVLVYYCILVEISSSCILVVIPSCLLVEISSFLLVVISF